jgi:hypothetical protein
MTDIFQWPTDWYRFVSGSFRLKAFSQVAPLSASGGRAVYGPHSQIFVGNLTLAPQAWDAAGQAMAAFFSRLDGQAALMRIGHVLRRQPQYNRLAGAAAAEAWSDSTFFDDGSGFAAGALPDTCTLAADAALGDKDIVLAGLTVSVSRALRRGDLIELRAGGVATAVPNLYEVQADADSDGSGNAALEVRPRMRQGFAAGDMAVLTDPTSVFRLVDDDQGIAEVSKERWASIGFSLVEAIDQAG